MSDIPLPHLINRQAMAERWAKALRRGNVWPDAVRIAPEAWWEQTREDLREERVPSPETRALIVHELEKLWYSGAFDAALDSTEPSEEGAAPPSPGSSPAPSEPSEAPGLLGPDVAAAPSGRETGTDKLPASATASDDASHRPTSGPVVQASIFDPPYQRHSETSRLAAEAAKKTQGPSHQRIIALLRERGPLIDQQMQELLEMNESTQRPRRRELAIAGVIEVVGRGVTRAGNPAVKWGLREEAQVAS